MTDTATVRVSFEKDGVVKVRDTDVTRSQSNKDQTRWYNSFDNMPQWMQDKVLKLQIVTAPPPRIDVANVGHRTSRDVFWLVAPEDEDGGNTRE